MENYSMETVKKIEFVKQLNDEFILCKCYVMSHGKNRNMTYISKENVERNLGTLDYAPVVGYLYRNNEGQYRIAGHEAHFDTETWELINDTQAFGVVKPNSYAWETIDEYGTNAEYLTCEIIVWVGRYAGLMDSIYDENTYWGQSMELNVAQYRPYEEDSNYMELLDFSFSALCLLGKYDNPDEHVEPCFINGKVEPIKFSVAEFTAQLEEIKNKIFTLEEEGDNVENEKELMPQEEETAAEETTVEETPAQEEETPAEVEETPAEETPTVDYEAKCAEYESTVEALNSRIADLENQIAELTPYKLASEQAARESAESEVFAKYDAKIGDMTEYAELKAKAGEYSIEELDRECLVLVGMYAMSTTSEAPAAEEEKIQFAYIADESTKTNTKYANLYNEYGKK